MQESRLVGLYIAVHWALTVVDQIVGEVPNRGVLALNRVLHIEYQLCTIDAQSLAVTSHDTVVVGLGLC